MVAKPLSHLLGAQMKQKKPIIASVLCVFALLTGPTLTGSSPAQAQSLSSASATTKLSKYQTIYFATGSSRLGDRSRTKLRHLLPTLRKQTAITITGYVQKGGPANPNLSKKRAKAVAQYLRKHGVTAPITIIANRTPKKNATSASARRVVITWSSQPSGRTNQKGVLWSQEFNEASGSAPSSKVWGYDLGGGGFGNSEFQYYTNSRQNSATDGLGALVIKATSIDEYDPLRDNCNVDDANSDCPTYRSARIKTQDKVGFLYGHIEARMWLPEGTGTWPAFWMLGADFGGIGWPDCGELDIMEQGNDKTAINGTIHSNGPDIYMGLTGSAYADFGSSFAGGWHTFAINWLPNSIQWLVDGDVYHEVNKVDVEAAGYEWVFDHENFIIFNLAAGGNYVGGVNPDAPYEMKIDYLRVSSYNGYGAIIKH